MDLDDDMDETFIAYNKIMEKRSHKIEADPESVTKQAFKVYHKLLTMKARRST